MQVSQEFEKLFDGTERVALQIASAFWKLADLKARRHLLNPENRRIIRRRKKRLLEKRSWFCCVINRYFKHDELNLWEQRVRFIRAMGSDTDIY